MAESYGKTPLGSDIKPHGRLQREEFARYYCQRCQYMAYFPLVQDRETPKTEGPVCSASETWTSGVKAEDRW